MAARSKAKRRAPLIESDTEEALRRRGTELLGLILLALAALATAMFWTYSPDDPSLFSATDAAPQNALGLVGASIADPMHRALGWAAYGIPVALAAWGLRLVLHAGETRAVSRAIAVPVALLAAAAFAATHVPLSGWQFDYGLGGMLGDAAVSGLVSLMPLDLSLALVVTSLALALAFALSTGYALGVTWAELRGFLAWVAWLFIHILYLVGFRAKLSTLGHWAVAFIGRARSERTFTLEQARGALTDERERRDLEAG